MNSISLIKVAGAFAAGIVVALGSALIWVKVADRSPSAPVAQAASQAPVTAPAASQAGEEQQPPESDESETADVKDQPTEAERPQTAAKPVVKHKTESPKAHASSPAAHVEKPEAPIDVARNTPPASAPPNPYTQDGSPSQNPSNPTQPDQTAAAVQPTAPAAPAQPAPPHTVTLQAGTELVVSLNETLSTEHNYTGDAFRATLAVPVVSDGFIIADKGSKVLGRVVNARRAGKVQGLSQLDVAVTEINTTDGQRVDVQTNSVERKGTSSSGRDAAKVAGGAALGAIIGAIAGGGKGAGIGAGVGGAAGAGDVLLTRGKPAVLTTETRLTFRLSAPVSITEKLN